MFRSFTNLVLCLRYTNYILLTLQSRHCMVKTKYKLYSQLIQGCRLKKLFMTLQGCDAKEGLIT